MITVDTNALQNTIDECFQYSEDLRLTDDQQDEFRERGHRLRDQMAILLGKRFDDGTQDVLDANDKLTAVCKEMKKDVETLAHVAETLKTIATVIGDLETLAAAAGALGAI